MKSKKKKLNLNVFKVAHLTSLKVIGRGDESIEDKSCKASCDGSCPPQCDVPVIGNGQKSKNRDTKCPSRDNHTC